MFCSSKIKLQSQWMRAFAVFFALLMVAAPCAGQDDSDDSDDSKSAEPAKTASVFSRMFGPSTKKPTPTASKPKVPATTTAAKGNRGGFMVPLKSFTKAFRAPSEAEIAESMDVEDVMPKSPPRLPREPFRNLTRAQETRAQERRDRATNDLSVEVEEPSLFPIQSNSGRAPIVGGEPAVKPLAKPKSDTQPSMVKAPAVRPKPENLITQTDVTAKTQSESVKLESSSTSRRTASNAVISESPSPVVSDKPSLHEAVAKRSQTAASNVKEKALATASSAASKAKNLLDLGDSNSAATIAKPLAPDVSNLTQDDSSTLSSALSSTTAKPTAPSAQEPAPSEAMESDELPKINRSSNVASEVKRRGTEQRSTEPRSEDRPTAGSASSSMLRHEMSVPSVKVNVNGPSALLVNQEASYDVVAKNDGRSPLNGLAVRVAVPTHVSVGQFSASAGTAQLDNDQDGNAIVWQLDQLEAGESKNLRLILQSPKPEHFALGLEWTLMPQLAELPLQVQQPQLAVAIEGPSEVEFGKPQTYRIRVKNPGNADVKAVSIALTAEPYGSNQSDIGDVAAGAERVVEVEMTFQQSGTLPVVASAFSTISQLKAQSAVDVQVRQSELVATWFGPSEFYQGSPTDYELELTNTGSIAAVGVECKIKLPPGSESVTLPPGSTRSGEIVKWDIKRIEPSQKLSIPLRMTLTKLGENSIEFDAKCSSSSDVNATILTSIDSIADLHLAVTDPVAPAPVGQPVVYEIVITNRGKKAASEVEVVAQFSEGVEPIRLEGGAGRIVPGQAIFNPVATIKPNEKLVLKVVAEASKSGVHRFRTEVKCVGSDADLLEEESTRFLATNNKSDRR
jgi:hypothetical protein